MNLTKIQKNLLHVTIIIAVTIAIPIILTIIPGYFKPARPNNLVDLKQFLIPFLLFDILLIGIAAGIHRIYTPDYSRLKNVWLFVLFGGITGGLLGEGGNPVMIIPYSILMFIYAQFYKRFTWWKVALSSYLAGILIENGLNRAPLQIPTLMWIAFFTYPYFVAKIFENRKNLSLTRVLKDLSLPTIFSLVLGFLAVYFSRNNISPPLIFLGIILPYFIAVIVTLAKTFTQAEN